MTTPSLIRKNKRALRRSLSPYVQAEKSAAINLRLISTTIFRFSHRVACYLPHQGEVSTQLLIEQIHRRDKHCFLPKLHPLKKGLLNFAKYAPCQKLTYNQFFILEPTNNHIIKPWCLDLVIVPLVAFDSACHRLGMGGGYYDKTFSFLAPEHKRRKPTLVGLAYECQKTIKLTPKHWDISLDYIVTEKTIYTRQ